ncbi:non-specific serine/threonine protein kinase [Salvia divinorum]|uniref:Non-specific serine/threonine protein kinase n=1 Tax=Salvia divinorum TaxID=28513 RepID=A0ABD1GLV6_SALDI
MESSLFHIAILVFISNSFSFTSSQSLFNLTTDQLSLIAFKNSITSNPNSTFLNNWSTKTPICGWNSVSCSQKHRRVTALNLPGLDLRGTIAPHLGNLTFLQEINLAANNFTGEIPPWIGALSELRHMNLSKNMFSGGIPASLFNISRLQSLNLIGSLSMPRRLYLWENLFQGRIPKQVGNLSSLTVLNLESNRLTGEAMVQTKTLATIGYAAPEYGSEGKVSTSADLFRQHAITIT